jgi:thiol:disulfide interchange protein DsbD
VTWSLAIEPDARIAPGRPFTAVLTATIDRGWGIYAMSQPPGGPIAMTVEMPKSQPFAFAGAVVEPAPTKKIDRTFANLETLYFEGTPAFTIPVRAQPGTSPGPHELIVNVEYQACSAELCHRPTTVTLKVPVTVSAR